MEAFAAAVNRASRIRKCRGSKTNIPLASAIASLCYAGHEVTTSEATTTARITKLGELLKYSDGAAQATCHEFLHGFVTSAMSKVRATDAGNQVVHTPHAITNWLVRLNTNLPLP